MDIASPVVADGDEIRKFPEHVKILTYVNDARRFNKLFKTQSMIIILRHSFFRPDHSSRELGVFSSRVFHIHSNVLYSFQFHPREDWDSCVHGEADEDEVGDDH